MTVDEFDHQMHAIVDSFDFNLPGIEGSLGRDVMMAVVEGIMRRSEDEKKGAEVDWPKNTDGVAKRKEKRYLLTDAPNEQTGQMLSQKSLIGQTTIEPELVTMIYGVNTPPDKTKTGVKLAPADERVTDVEKAYYAHTGQSKQKILRPFYELDDTIATDVIKIVGDALNDHVREANSLI
jgi:hypothetical protein